MNNQSVAQTSAAVSLHPKPITARETQSFPTLSRALFKPRHTRMSTTLDSNHTCYTVALQSLHHICIVEIAASKRSSARPLTGPCARIHQSQTCNRERFADVNDAPRQG